MQQTPPDLGVPAMRGPNPRGVLWAARRYLMVMWRRLLRTHATPHEIALGCAVGVFAACTPFLGLQMALAALLAYALRVNLPAALIATFVGNPFSWPAIWGASYVAGLWVLGVDPAFAAGHIVEGANALGETLKNPTPEKIDAAVLNLSTLLQPMLIGGVLIGLLAAAITYYPTWRAVRLFQMRRAVH